MNVSIDGNIRAAVVFLNMFGLYLSKEEGLVLGEVINIVDKNGVVVGKVRIGEEVVIEAKNAFGELKANYKLAQALCFRDLEVGSMPRHASWMTQIHYVINNNEESMRGLINFDVSIDDEFGLRCLAHQDLEYFVNDEKAFSLVMQNRGITFGLEFFEGNKYEVIQLRPFSLYLPYMLHDIKQGGNRCKYCCVSNRSEKNPDQFMVLSFDVENGEKVNKVHNFVDKEEYNSLHRDGKKTFFQIWQLVRQVDPDIYTKIIKVRELLKREDISLLDSFINISLMSFNDEEIEAMLGIKRQELKFKGYVRELKQIYFNGNSFPMLKN